MKWPGPRAFVVLGTISVLSFVASWVLANRSDAFGSPGAIAIFGAVAGTAITSAVGSVLTWTPRPPSGSDRVSHMSGFVRLTSKSSLSGEEWLHVLTQAKSEFYLAGHTLGKWCENTHREVFESNIARILKHSGGTVKLVILAPGSPELERLTRATGTDYSKRLGESMRALGPFVRSLPEAHRARLTISTLEDHMALPYMLVGNERTLITATYLASRDSDEVPCLELDRGSDAAIAIYDDFCKLADKGKRSDLDVTTPNAL